MDVSLLQTSASTSAAYASPGGTQSKDNKVAENAKHETPAAVYDKSEKTDGKKSSGYSIIDREKVQALVEESNKQTEAFVAMMQKIMLKQANASSVADSAGGTDGADWVNELLGKTTKLGQVDFNISKSQAMELAKYADADTVKWAQEQISDNGYYGVEKTSDRIVGFAKALSGGDPSKIGLMRDSILKGFEEAEKAWGDKLPEISQKTLEAVKQKLDAWEAEATTKNTTNNILGQAAASMFA